MFAPSSNQVVAPITSAIFTKPAGNITEYCESFRATDPTTIATIGSIILVIATGANAAADAELKKNCSKMFARNCFTDIIGLCATPKDTDIDDNSDNIRAILLNGDAAINWIADLVNAAKKKPITDGNVEGYFAALGHTATKSSAVARIINMIQVFLPDNIKLDTFRAVLVDNVWTRYRCTRVSAGVILSSLLPDFYNLRILTKGDEVDLAIIASSKAAYDLELGATIPDKYKAYGCIFLQVCGTPIDGWKQGNKAVDNMPAARVRGCKTIFRKYLDIKNSVDVDEFDSISAMNTSDAVRDFF